MSELGLIERHFCFLALYYSDPGHELDDLAVDVLQEGTVASNRDHGLAADTVLYMAEGATAE